jgi:hypothetical protein
MTLPTDYVDGDVLTAADVNAITVAVNSNTTGKLSVGTFNAKGDLLVGLTNDSVGVLSVGTNGYLLSASSGSASGLAWTAAGGKLIGFGYGTDTTERSTTSASAVDISGLSVTYTPVSASSTLVIDMFVTAEIYRTGGTPQARTGKVILNESGVFTQTAEFGATLDASSSNPNNQFSPVHIRAVVASTGTSARTFKGQMATTTTDNTVFIKNNIATGVISVMEIG